MVQRKFTLLIAGCSLAVGAITIAASGESQASAAAGQSATVCVNPSVIVTPQKSSTYHELMFAEVGFSERHRYFTVEWRLFPAIPEDVRIPAELIEYLDSMQGKQLPQVVSEFVRVDLGFSPTSVEAVDFNTLHVRGLSSEGEPVSTLWSLPVPEDLVRFDRAQAELSLEAVLPQRADDSAHAGTACHLATPPDAAAAGSAQRDER